MLEAVVQVTDLPSGWATSKGREGDPAEKVPHDLLGWRPLLSGWRPSPASLHVTFLPAIGDIPQKNPTDGTCFLGLTALLTGKRLVGLSHIKFMYLSFGANHHN